MTIHDYAHLSEHRARLDRISRRHEHLAATPHRRSLREEMTTLGRTLADRRSAGADTTGTRRLAHVRGR